MNRTELIDKVQALGIQYGIPLNYMIVGFGGAMLLMGFRDSTRDIDIDVPQDVYAIFRRQGHTERPIQNALGGFTLSLTPDIDIRVDPNIGKTGYCDVGPGGIWHHTPEIVLENKLILNRDKDQEDILRLKAYLG